MAENSINNLIHLLASTSKHAHPALLDLIDYIDTIKKLPNKIDFDTINEIFKITLNFVDTDEEINSVYQKWTRFILRFAEDPFKVDLKSLLPERIRTANNVSLKISKIIDDNWNNDVELPEEMYNDIINSTENSQKLELLKFLVNDKYEPKIKENAEPELTDALEILFKKYYYDGQKEKALNVLRALPASWQRFWNEHLCDPSCNETIDSLLFMLEHDKTNSIPNKEVLILQLELKALVNDIEGKIGEEGFVDEEILRQVALEIELKYSDIDENSEEMVDIFTTKLYEKTIFSKAKAISTSIPNDINNDELVSLYIDLKKIFEFCEEQGVDKATPYLDKINKVLFNELKDVASGISVIEKMLKNNSHIKISQYLEQLLYIIEPSSIEMETLYSMLAKHIGTQRLSPRQYNMYANVFSRSHHPHFKILYTMLNTLQKDESSIGIFATELMSNWDVFKNDPQLLYISIEPIFHARVNLRSVQEFVTKVMSFPVEPFIIKSMTHLLIDYLNEQQYLDFNKGLPKISASQKNINEMQKILDSIVDTSMEDPTAELEFESKWMGIEKCRTFLNSLTENKMKLSLLSEVIT